MESQEVELTVFRRFRFNLKPQDPLTLLLRNGVENRNSTGAAS